eukprot:NODE_3063_length_986_cov_11.814301_g2559_i0.p1 GENE.NODE_3063_length_986_cov_11.814301_g2559_i0~~NODE_3063_length_986_cov_11.814301_g2559_i0.p1  ORF type:complete len:272 (+),score=62.70 NODE_3063_length_986_cov_11.814301_g2559_i0:124-939(+)
MGNVCVTDGVDHEFFQHANGNIERSCEPLIGQQVKAISLNRHDCKLDLASGEYFGFRATCGWNNVTFRSRREGDENPRTQTSSPLIYNPAVLPLEGLVPIRVEPDKENQNLVGTVEEVLAWHYEDIITLKTQYNQHCLPGEAVLLRLTAEEASDGFPIIWEVRLVSTNTHPEGKLSDVGIQVLTGADFEPEGKKVPITNPLSADARKEGKEDPEVLEAGEDMGGGGAEEPPPQDDPVGPIPELDDGGGAAAKGKKRKKKNKIEPEDGGDFA